MWSMIESGLGYSVNGVQAAWLVRMNSSINQSINQSNQNSLT
jgi:hypothetical protein